MTPKVSVLMPVFNGEQLLERALQSLLRQSFADFEIIILDNLSTDSTPLICQRLAQQDHRINYVRDTQHRTTHEAANYLAGLAQREYCISACDDDLWEPELLEVLVGLIEADQTAAIAVANCRSIDLDDRYVGRSFLRKQEIFLMKLGPFFFWWSYLVKRNVVPLVFALFRTEVWKNSLPFKTFDWTGADVDNLFVLSVTKDHRIAITEKVLFGYRAKTRPKPPGQRNTLFSETWNHYKYFVPHQVLFTQELIALLKNSKFNLAQKIILRLRIYWAFGIQILVLFPLGLVLGLLRRDKNQKLDQTIANERIAAISLQTEEIGYLWREAREK